MEQGWSNVAVEKGEPGPGWGTDALRNQTLRISAYLGHSPSKNILENHNKMILTSVCGTLYSPLLAGLPGVPVRQTAEIKIQVGKPKTVMKALTRNFFMYHNYEDEIIPGPRVLAEGSRINFFKT